MEDEKFLVLKTVVGSKLHRLDNKDSDTDIMTVYRSPLHVITSPFHRDRGSVKVGETNTTELELRHFCKLLASCNPTALEVLWSDMRLGTSSEDCTLSMNRKKFLTSNRIFDSHLGYANSQLKNLLDSNVSSTRRGKAMAAYLRVLSQGSQLLATGTFSPKVLYSPNRLRELKKGVTYEQVMEKRHWFFDASEASVQQLKDTYVEYPDKFTMNQDWIETFIALSYLRNV